MAKLNGLLRERGILKGENKYYVSTAIDEQDVVQTIGIWSDAIGAMRST
jgi:glutamate-1-semialdehyde 2,1-aminomutase